MDKTELLFQMMEQPDKYTHEQWQDILADEECRELYMLMSKTKSAFDVQREVSDEEIDAEWQRLQQQTTAEETTSDIRSRHRWLNIAAMFVGLLVLSGIAYAAVRIISSDKVRISSAIVNTEDDIIMAEASMIESVCLNF